MKRAAAPLPDDVEALKAIIVRQAAEGAQKEAQIERYKAQLTTLQQQLNLLLAKRFGPSSEKVPADQLRLFNEAEAEAEHCEAHVCERDESAITVAAHTRGKRGRKPLPAELPRVDIVHDLPEEKKVCAHDGHRLVEIGAETSEQLDIVPAQVRVLRHIRKKYACPCCEQGVTTAPLPAQPIPKSIASPGLLAHIAVAKYQDALPLYRQEQILKRIGVELPRASLAGWMIKAGQLIQPLINLMHERLLDYDIVHMDETTVQVLKEPGKAAQSTSYIWVQRGGPPEHPLILYDYDPSRSQAVPKRLLEGYRGYLQTDGYEGYNGVCREQEIVPIGCWAHARRKFDEALKAQGTKGKPKAGRALMGLNFIQRLYRIEKAVQDGSAEQRYEARQQQARPVLDALRDWLEKSLPGVPPSTATGKALGYLHTQWDKLIGYLDDGRLPIDNNRTENAIRPFVLGRKNWLFSDTVHGAKASANLYSLVETAKANGLEPYRYLRQVFKQLPRAQTVAEIEALLPGNVDPEKLPAATNQPRP